MESIKLQLSVYPPGSDEYRGAIAQLASLAHLAAPPPLPRALDVDAPGPSL